MLGIRSTNATAATVGSIERRVGSDPIGTAHASRVASRTLVHERPREFRSRKPSLVGHDHLAA
ncbi:hypothetical protein ACFQIA_15080 [Halalkalicoccus sp. GCM10025704]